MRTYLILILISLFSIINQSVEADPIFAEKRPDGSVVYTDKPKDPRASIKVELSPLARYTPSSNTLPSKGETSAQNTAPTCYAHGGTNCAAGADTDGSVICSDGFSDVRARYNMSCRQVKLAVNNVEYDSKKRELRVLVRNTSQIPAYKIVVLIKQKGGQPDVSQQVDQIDPFGAGDFVFNNLILLDNLQNKIVDNLVVSCQNCG